MMREAQNQREIHDLEAASIECPHFLRRDLQKSRRLVEEQMRGTRPQHGKCPKPLIRISSL